MLHVEALGKSSWKCTLVGLNLLSVKEVLGERGIVFLQRVCIRVCVQWGGNSRASCFMISMWFFQKHSLFLQGSILIGKKFDRSHCF